jgi:hypothetical protein
MLKVFKILFFEFLGFLVFVYYVFIFAKWKKYDYDW